MRLAPLLFLLLGCTDAQVLLERDDAGRDAGPDAGRDAGRARDAEPDAARDGGVDASQDEGADAGPEPVTWGSPCAVDADCAPVCVGVTEPCAPFCRDDRGCATDCVTDADCPPYHTCVADGAGRLGCAPRCDVVAADPCEPTGLGCRVLADGSAYCVRGCTQDDDCPVTRACERTSTGGRCFRPGRRVGATCAVRQRFLNDCEATHECWILEPTTRAGVCVAPVCRPGASADCESRVDVNSTCVEIVVEGNEPEYACVPRCGTDDSCPEGLVCRSHPHGRACLPPG